jgi:hypothetical protein
MLIFSVLSGIHLSVRSDLRALFEEMFHFNSFERKNLVTSDVVREAKPNWVVAHRKDLRKERKSGRAIVLLERG